jgi:hypothetical protein
MEYVSSRKDSTIEGSPCLNPLLGSAINSPATCRQACCWVVVAPQLASCVMYRSLIHDCQPMRHWLTLQSPRC